MNETKHKIIFDVPDEVFQMLQDTKKEQMLGIAPIARLAIKEYCGKVLQDKQK